MEYLILLGAIVLFGALLFVKGLWDDRRRFSWQRRKIRDAFGRMEKREYADGEFYGIPRYYEKHRESFTIDDITWNDLNLDEIFLQMNGTLSSAGQEYLYYLLRTPCFSEEELLKRERLMRYFTEQEQERLEAQMLFFKMGRTGKYSIYDYLDFLDDLGMRGNALTILLDIGILAAVGLLAVAPSVGLMALIVLMCVNIGTYFKEKGRIEPYMTSFKYVLRSLEMAESFIKLPTEALHKEKEMVKRLLSRFKGLKRSAAVGMHTMGTGASPLDLLMDYLNMIFHFDIIGFNRMLMELRKHAQDIDELLTVTGRVDALIAAASWRSGLETFCEPQFSAGGFAADGLYHPLLTEPVKNGIHTKRGVLLTGSNASGKSTFLKAVAVNAILAQTIHTCCADSYEAGFFRIYTSMALRDDMGSGESYYIVEIKSLKRILDAAGEDGASVLCFVDEVLRGTNTVERIAASTQILKSLNRPGVICFAATHDIELTELLERQYDNYHFEEEIEDGDIRFPYLLLSGKATTRNAIKLLSIMGYDAGIIAEAEKQAASFVQSGRWRQA